MFDKNSPHLLSGYSQYCIRKHTSQVEYVT